MTSLVVLLSCLAENLVIMGEETSVRSPPKHHSLRHVRVVKQLITVVLDLTRGRVDPGAFQSNQLDISMIFYVRKLSSASCYSQNDRDAWSNGHRSFKQE